MLDTSIICADFVELATSEWEWIRELERCQFDVISGLYTMCPRLVLQGRLGDPFVTLCDSLLFHPGLESGVMNFQC